MKLLIALFALSFSSAALADTYVKGYSKKDGTYVQPHYRSSSDSNKFNNYSTQGNSNPYTGQQGTSNPYAMPEIKPYSPPPTYNYSNPYNNN